jgi:protein-S-isoprenylcysteine O-methyltransferase Ste14
MRNSGATVRQQRVREAAVIILLHQALFQGLFIAKNVTLRLKLGKPIRGNNPEARAAVAFLMGFIALSIYFAWTGAAPGTVHLLSNRVASSVCLALLAISTVLGLASLRDLGDSWRVGVLEEQRTDLVEDGVYRFTRNPYFVAYLLMTLAYTILLQNLVLLVLTVAGCGLIHRMIVKEERYLESLHGEAYRHYRQRVPRYLLR